MIRLILHSVEVADTNISIETPRSSIKNSRPRNKNQVADIQENLNLSQ